MKRILTAAWLIPASTYCIFFAHHYLFLAVVCLIALLCYREYERMVRNQDLHTFALVGAVLGLLLLAVPAITWADFLVLPVLGLGLSLRTTDGAHGFKGAFASAGAFALGILYIFGAWRAGIALHTKSAHWLFFAVALNWAGDVAAYYVGRAIGKHKLAPLISPGKSREGAAASILASVAFGYFYLGQFLPAVPVSLAILLAAAGNVAGQIGDLSESALKRGAQMKDSGTMLSGHGGWLDRLDSSLFSMPVIYWLLETYSRN
jgi:phosphatidate cytidylyltransferase